MFNMATGSGKTLVMAALILYYYKNGYRNFIFFVNQNAILGKNLSNFIESAHSKYLFSENIVIDGTHVNIREVELFSDSSNDIQIKFTTIQKLHNDIYKEGENALLLSDLQKRNIVLIGDEAHHLNASTSKKKSSNNEFSNDISFIKDEKKENIKGMYLFINKKKENPKRRLKTLPEDFKNLPSFEAKILTSIYSEVHTVDFAKKYNEHYAAESKALSAIKKSFSEIPLHIRQKAVHKLNTNSESYFCFENLRKRFSVESIEDFFNFIEDIKISITSDTKFEELPNKKLLSLCEDFLLYVQRELEKYDKPFIGTDFHLVKFSDIFTLDDEKGKITFTKEKMILMDDPSKIQENTA